MGFFDILSNIAIITSLVKTSVETVEAVAGPGRGVDKKAAVLASVNQIFGLSGQPFSAENAALLDEAIGDLIDVVVKINNATGAFKKRT